MTQSGAARLMKTHKESQLFQTK